MKPPPTPAETPPGAPIPPVREDSSPEEKDLHWLSYVYQGDRQPQLTLRAVLMGGLLGMFMSISNLYTTLRLGWAFGVAITACVLSFVIWNGMRKLSGGRLEPMSILESNCMQSTASSAGYGTGATVGAAFAALLLIQGSHHPWPYLTAFVFLTAALGVFLAIPLKRQMINYQRLPFPSGIAAAETLKSLHLKGEEALRRARSLLAALAAGGIVGLCRSGAIFAEQLRTTGRPQLWLEAIFRLVQIPEEIPLRGWLKPGAGAKLAGFSFEPSVLLMGAGMIIGLRVSLSMLASSSILYFVLVPLLLAIDSSHSGQPGFVSSLVANKAGVINPVRWAIWGGSSIMVFASLTSVVLQWRMFARAFGSLRGAGRTAESADLGPIEVPSSWFACGMVPITIGMVAVQVAAFDVSITIGLVAVAMSFVVAIVCCRATGETDTTPTGAMGKVTQLLYAVLPGTAGSTTVNLMSAGLTTAAGSSSADLLTDLKSGYLLGANARQQFLAQLAGVLFGTLAVVPAWYLMVPTREVLESYPAPAAHMWKAVADLLTQGVHMLPSSALVAIGGGCVIGVLLPVLEWLFPTARPYLPSAMGLGLGLAMPYANSLSFAIGAAIAWLWSRATRESAETYTIPVASGLVAGESLVQSFIAIACSLAGLFPARL